MCVCCPVVSDEMVLLWRQVWSPVCNIAVKDLVSTTSWIICVQFSVTSYVATVALQGFDPYCLCWTGLQRVDSGRSWWTGSVCWLRRSLHGVWRLIAHQDVWCWNQHRGGVWPPADQAAFSQQREKQHHSTLSDILPRLSPWRWICVQGELHVPLAGFQTERKQWNPQQFGSLIFHTWGMGHWKTLHAMLYIWWVPKSWSYH